MPGLGAVAADGVAARRDLARPLVLRGEGKERKSTSLCTGSAPEVLETWLVCSTPSMSEGSWELSSGRVGSEPSTPCGGKEGGALPPLDTHCA